jgi:hypothetical protein
MRIRNDITSLYEKHAEAGAPRRFAHPFDAPQKGIQLGGALNRCLSEPYQANGACYGRVRERDSGSRWITNRMSHVSEQ